MKTTELTGAALDWAVSKAEGMEGHYLANPYSYSTNWIFGGSIIERWEIDTNKSGLHTWRAKTISIGRFYEATGTTPLIAAMRCYVASKLGDDVEIPNELNSPTW